MSANYMTVSSMPANYMGARTGGSRRKKRDWTDEDFQESRRRYGAYLAQEIDFNQRHGSHLTDEDVRIRAEERLRQDGLPTAQESQLRADLDSINLSGYERFGVRAHRAQLATINSLRKRSNMTGLYTDALEAAADKATQESSGVLEDFVSEGAGMVTDPVWLATYGAGRVLQAGKYASMAPWKKEIVKDVVAGVPADFGTSMIQTGGDVQQSLSNTGTGAAFAVGGGIVLRGLAKALRVASPNITPEKIRADATKALLRDPEAISEINRLRGTGLSAREAEQTVLSGLDDQLTRALDPEQGTVRGLLDAKRQGMPTYDQYVAKLQEASDAETRGLMAQINESIYDVDYQRAGVLAADNLENRRILQSELNARKADAAADEVMADVAERRAREIADDPFIYNEAEKRARLEANRADLNDQVAARELAERRAREIADDPYIYNEAGKQARLDANRAALDEQVAARESADARARAIADDPYIYNEDARQARLDAARAQAAASDPMAPIRRAREIVPDAVIQESRAIRQAEQDAALGQMGVAMYGVRKEAGRQAELLNKANDIDAEVPSSQVDKFYERAKKTTALRGDAPVQELPNARPEVEADVAARQADDAIRSEAYKDPDTFELINELEGMGYSRAQAEAIAIPELDTPAPRVEDVPNVGADAPDLGAPKEPWQMSKSEFIRDTETTPKGNKTDSPSPNKYKEGDLVIDGYGDDPYVYQLQRVNPEELSFSLEGEELSRVVGMPTTQQYIEWYKQGIDPPPVDVVIKDSGARHSTNRRRVVAAREAGVKDIPAFVEIGRHKSMVKQALAEGKPVPPEVLKDYPDLAPTRPVEGARVDQWSSESNAARKSMSDIRSEASVHLQVFDGPVADGFSGRLLSWASGGDLPPRVSGTVSGRPFKSPSAAERAAVRAADRTGSVHSVVAIADKSDRLMGYAVVEAPTIPGTNQSLTNPSLFAWDQVIGKSSVGTTHHFPSSPPPTALRSGIAPDDIAAMVSDAIAAGKWTAKQAIIGARWALEVGGDAIKTMRDFAGVMLDKFGRGIRKHIPEMWQKFKQFRERRAAMRQQTARRRQFGGIDLRNKVPKNAQQQIASKARAEAKAVAREQRADREANRAMADMGVKERLPMSERGKFLTRVRKANTANRVNKTLIQADRARAKLEKDLAIEKSRKELLKQIKGRKDSPIRIAAQNSEFADDFNRIHSLGVKDPRKGPTLGELRRMDDGQRAAVVRAYADIEAKFLKSRADVHVGEEVTDAARGIAKEVNGLGHKEMKVTDGATGERNASLLKQVGREESLQPERLVERLGKRAMAEIYNPIAESKGNYYKTVKSFNEELTARLKQAGIADPESGKWLNSVSGPRANKRTVKLDGQDVTFTDGQFWSLLANLTDPQTRKLVEGGAPITLANDTTRRFKIDEDGLRTILASSTEQDRAVVKAIKEVYNGTSKDRLNKTWRELFGKDLATHDDYFPRMRDVEKTIDDIEEVMRPAQDGTLTGRDLTKERAENPKAPVVIGDILSTSDKHFAQVSAIVEMAPAVRKVRAILGNREFKDATVRSYGDSMHNAIDTWVQDVIEEAGGFRRPMTPTQVTLGKLVSNTAVGVLGVNPWVILKQLPSFGNAMTEIDPRYMLQGAKDAIMLEPRAVRDRMFEHSPQIWARYKVHASRLIGDMRNTTPIQRSSKDLSDKLMAGISWADQNVIASIWRASELKVKAEQPNLGGDAYWKAVNDQADRVIRRTQPNFDSVNTSSIQRKGKGDPFMKAASMFMSQRNTNYNMLYSALASKDPKKIAAILGVVAIAQPLMISGVDETRDWMYGRQEHESGGDLALSLATDVVANNFSQVYFAGPILDPATRGVSNAISGKNNYIFPPSNPITSTANGIQEGIAKLLDGTIDGDGERAWDGFERAMLSAAALGGVPIRSPYRFAEELIERYNEADQED